jgi:hypothetical protein
VQGGVGQKWNSAAASNQGVVEADQRDEQEEDELQNLARPNAAFAKKLEFRTWFKNEN